jgi:tRNA(His) 5'-end guanylyltransferase
MKKDEFGDRMKQYENVECGRKFIPLLPICVRLDGRTFSKFTKYMNKPYDRNLVNIMKDTLRYLASETNAHIGYTQSDEITLVLHSSVQSSIFFGGKIFKIVSVLSSMCSGYFNYKIGDYFDVNKLELPVSFDCRAWQVPLRELYNVILWRKQDAVRNSISSLAHCYFSDNALMNKSTKERLTMLQDINIIWDTYPLFYKEGSLLVKEKELRKFTDDELEKLPEKHEAISNPDLLVERSVYNFVDFIYLKDYIKNTFQV